MVGINRWKRKNVWREGKGSEGEDSYTWSKSTTAWPKGNSADSHNEKKGGALPRRRNRIVVNGKEKSEELEKGKKLKRSF